MTIATTEPVYLPLTEASVRYALGVGTLRRWIAAKRLAAYRPAGRVLVSVAELDALVRAAPACHADGAGGVDE